MNKSGAPNFYSYFSLLPLLNKEDPKGYIHEQMTSIREHSSAYHRISTSVRAREECLQRLHKTLLKLKEVQIKLTSERNFEDKKGIKIGDFPFANADSKRDRRNKKLEDTAGKFG